MHNLVAATDDEITFRPILVVDDDGKTHFGKETEGAVVTAKPVGDKKGEKVKVFRYRPKTGYAKRGGHRQLMTLLEIADVSLGAKKPPRRAAPKAEKATKEPDKGAAEAAELEEEAASTAGDTAGDAESGDAAE